MTQSNLHEYEAFFRQAPGLLCILDAEGALRSHSAACEALLELPMEGPAVFIALVHDEDVGRAKASLEQARAGESPASAELRLRCKGGSYRGFRWSVRADPSSGALFGVLTETGAVAQELRRFRFLVDAITDMIGIADFTGQTEYINPNGCALLGYTLEEATTCNIMQFVPPHLHGRYQEEILPAVMRDGSWGGEVELVRKDGSPMPAYQGVVLLPDESGKPEAMVTLIHDITEQKRLEDALRQAIQELSTPIIQVWEGVLALPIIGVVDSDRATQMMHSLLEAIQSTGCKIAVLDLTGVRTLDTATINHLFHMVRAAALLGSRCVISGMSPTMAQTVASLGVDIHSLQAFRSLEEALRFAMQVIRA